MRENALRLCYYIFCHSASNTGEEERTLKMENENISIIESLSIPNQRVFTVDFFGNKLITTVTSTPSVVRNWIGSTLHRHNRRRLIIGLAIQWNPSNSDSKPVGVLQLCVERRCLIFQLTKAKSIPNALRHLLNDPQYIFVGIANPSDADRLVRSEHELMMSSDPVDLRYRAAVKLNEPELKSASMETLVSRVLGYDLDDVEKDRDVGKSNWNAYHLSDQQVLYAAVDVFVAFQIGKELQL